MSMRPVEAEQATPVGTEQAFSERVVVLLWRHRRSQAWLAEQLGYNVTTIRDKLRDRPGYRWQDEERATVAALLGTTLDAESLPRLDSNQQPSGYRRVHQVA